MNKQGFTLIELLVVLVILGILIAFLAPAINNTVEQARRVACLNNLRQMYIAMASYADDHGGQLKLIDMPDLKATMRYLFAYDQAVYLSFGIWDGTETIGYGELYSDGYIDDIGIFFCPSAKRWTGTSSIFPGTSYDPYDFGKSGIELWGTYIYFLHCHYKWMPTGEILTPMTFSEHSNKTIFSDIYFDSEIRNHLNGANVAMGDGSVRWHSITEGSYFVEFMEAILSAGE